MLLKKLVSRDHQKTLARLRGEPIFDTGEALEMSDLSSWN